MVYSSRRSQPYKPGQNTQHKLSRSKIELFMQCPRCFWLGERLQIKRPSSPPFNINKTIDELFKKEFDSHRESGTPHPIMVDNKVQAIPFPHPNLDKWRHNFTGIQALHKSTNFLIFGAVDDIWVNGDDELIVVDYKATSKNKEVSIDSDWQISYKRQIEIYQWLLRQNDFKVSDMGYFVYANARMDADGFGDKLEFITKLIPYEGKSGWVDDVLEKMKEVLENDEMPAVGVAAMGGPCEHCEYAKARTKLTLEYLKGK